MCQRWHQGPKRGNRIEVPRERGRVWGMRLACRWHRKAIRCDVRHVKGRVGDISAGAVGHVKVLIMLPAASTARKQPEPSRARCIGSFAEASSDQCCLPRARKVCAHTQLSPTRHLRRTIFQRLHLYQNEIDMGVGAAPCPLQAKVKT